MSLMAMNRRDADVAALPRVGGRRIARLDRVDPRRDVGLRFQLIDVLHEADAVASGCADRCRRR